MSIIEQAAKRLEELSRAGIDVQRPQDGHVEGRRAGPPAGLTLLPPGAMPLPPPEARQRHAPLQTAAGADLMSLAGGEVELDLAGLQAGGYLVPGDTGSRHAEEFRQIKRPLVKNARSKEAVANRLSLIMVTSALPGEGKTYSALNLAMSIATEIDLSVLLVDADVVRPQAMRRLGVGAEVGLMDLLMDKSLTLPDVVLRTNVPKLSVLPAGRRNHLSTELLASSAMEDLLRQLANDFPRLVVVFDAPPLLVTNEAKVLASRVGQIMFVVEAGRTDRSVVQQAFATLEQHPIVMSVLNKSTMADKSDGYGYGYGYGYD